MDKLEVLHNILDFVRLNQGSNGLVEALIVKCEELSKTIDYILEWNNVNWQNLSEEQSKQIRVSIGGVDERLNNLKRIFLGKDKEDDRVSNYLEYIKSIIGAKCLSAMDKLYKEKDKKGE